MIDETIANKEIIYKYYGSPITLSTKNISEKQLQEILNCINDALGEEKQSIENSIIRLLAERNFYNFIGNYFSEECKNISYYYINSRFVGDGIFNPWLLKKKR